jgi:predicted RNA methylase
MGWPAYIFLTILLLAFLSVAFTTIFYGIGPTPTSSTVRKELFTLLPNAIVGTIYELGAGWGTLAFPLAERYPQAKVIAIEISPLPYLWMRLILFFRPHPNLKIIYGDFFRFSFEDAGLIVCYLYPKAMTILEKKILHECKNAWIATHTFAFPQLKPQKVRKASDLYRTTVYLYKTGSDSSV